MEIIKQHCFNFPSMNALKLIASMVILIASFNVGAFFNDDLENEKEQNKLDTTKIEYYQKDNTTNQVPYFDNRFSS